MTTKTKTIYRATTPQDPEQWRWVATGIRRALRAEFPQAKFRVQKSLGDTATIRWSSGATISDVQKVLAPFVASRGGPLTPSQAEFGYVLGINLWCPRELYGCDCGAEPTT